MKNKMKLILKRFLSDKSIAKIKMGVEYFRFKRKIKNIEMNKKDYTLLIGTPLHTNLGDHLIALAEMKILRECLDKSEMIEIPTEMYQVYKERLKNAISKKSLICVTGGGWMGNLWPNEEMIIQDIVSNFKENKIIIMPQTIYYDSTKENYSEILKSAQSVYASCKDLTLFVREKQSLKFVSEFYKVKCFLIADIAMSYIEECVDKREDKDKKRLVLLCLREDREKEVKNQEIGKIQSYLKKQGYQIKKTSTMSSVRVPIFLRNYMVSQKLKEFSKAGIVVSDRLHGMIFAYLVKTPCIVMNNKTNKVFGVYDAWLKKSKRVLYLSNSFEESQLSDFISKFKDEDSELEKEIMRSFYSLKESIGYGKN